DETRIDTLRWRTNPGSTTPRARSTATQTRRGPLMADETRIDTLRWRTNPGSTTPRVRSTASRAGSTASRAGW
ncbi:MAG TPA: hypothetical protein VKS82_19145, partial [Streptosporangiaceae bacterium]|nr:hypothetical protein [Streptosporangiaceae bacterium]